MEFLLVALAIANAYLFWIFNKQKKTNLSLYAALIDQAVSTNSSESDKVKEDFLKFVSDSREWAFEYIENVQKEIQSILESMSESMKKIESKKRNSKDDKQLLFVYSRLQKLLPEQGN